MDKITKLGHELAAILWEAETLRDLEALEQHINNILPIKREELECHQ